MPYEMHTYRRRESVHADFVDPHSGLENFEFHEAQKGVQPHGTPHKAEEYKRDYAAAKIRKALMRKDLSMLPPELRDIRKLSDLTMLYTQQTLVDAKPKVYEDEGGRSFATADPAKDRNRYYLLPPLITQNVKAAYLGKKD
jgi:hypothetical protein